MTLEPDSKLTRTRRTKSLEERVAEALVIPYVGIGANDQDEAEKWAKFDAGIRESIEAEEAGIIGKTTAEIPMDPEATAEPRARAAHMGLGGPQEPTILVTGYDANGEAVDAEVTRSERAQDAAATGEPDPERPAIKQIEMPGFEGHKATKVQVNFGGPVVLDLGMPEHKRLWDALAWQGHAELVVSIYVADKMFKGRADATAVAAVEVLNARLAKEAGPACEACGSDTADTWEGKPICDVCFEKEATDDDGPLDAQSYEEIELWTGTLAQALAAALEGDE